MQDATSYQQTLQRLDELEQSALSKKGSAAWPKDELSPWTMRWNN